MYMHAAKQAAALEEVRGTECRMPQQHWEQRAGGGRGCLSRLSFPKLEIKHAAGSSVGARGILAVREVRCHILSAVSHLGVRQQLSALAAFRSQQSKEP